MKYKIVRLRGNDCVVCVVRPRFPAFELFLYHEERLQIMQSVMFILSPRANYRRWRFKEIFVKKNIPQGNNSHLCLSLRNNTLAWWLISSLFAPGEVLLLVKDFLPLEVKGNMKNKPFKSKFERETSHGSGRDLITCRRGCQITMEWMRRAFEWKSVFILQLKSILLFLFPFCISSANNLTAFI